jgi:hypothetical protein
LTLRTSKHESIHNFPQAESTRALCPTKNFLFLEATTGGRRIIGREGNCTPFWRVLSSIAYPTGRTTCAHSTGSKTPTQRFCSIISIA